MIKSKRSLYNAASALLLSCLNGILGFIVTRLILSTYGSDFYGLNATATQLVNMLSILEGGFTVATNVAMFKPIAENDTKAINQIITATRNTFRKIGVLFLTAGVIGSVAYCFIVKTQLPNLTALLILLMAVLPSAFNFFYATKYRILLQAEQKEYMISLAGICTVSVGYIVNIIVINLELPVLTVRLVTMIFAFLQCFFIGWFCKKHYKYIDFTEKPNYAAIKGTRDIFVQKITGVIYSTMPMLFISSMSGEGTKQTSVYAVYNNVFVLFKTLLHAVMDAPRLSFGQLIAEKDRDYVYKRFLQYELVVICMLACTLSTIGVLIMPFIKLYTKGLSDINYTDPLIALLLLLITAFEIVHIPSGHIINMSGNFHVGKRIQLIACIVLVVSMTVGTLFFDVYGILSAILLTAVLLAFLEIGFVHKRYFSKIWPFFKLLIPNLIICIVLTVVESALLGTVSNYVVFALYGVLIFAVNTLVVGIANFILNREGVVFMFSMFKHLLGRSPR